MGSALSVLQDCESALGILGSIGRSLQCLLGPAQGCVCLETTQESLSSASRKLWFDRNELENDVRRQETENKLCIPRVKGWFESVDDLLEKVDQIKKASDERPALGESCSLRPLFYRCWLATEMAKLSKQVSTLANTTFEGDRVREVPPVPSPVPSKPLMIGRERTLDQIEEYLRGYDKGIIGIYGMGGVGKTTLLKRIQYDFSTEAGFQSVIWVDLSKQTADKHITKTIRQQICGHLKKTDWGTEHLHGALTGKTFLLLLDGVWSKLSLEDAGIPIPADNQNTAKVVLTTQSRAVCQYMGAYPVKVGVLEDVHAKLLFRQTFRDHSLLGKDGINLLVGPIVSECGGLPLALKVVAGAMASITTFEGWQEALKKLKNSPQEINGMKDKLFNVLNFGFEQLNERSRQCFLYCSLFPEKYDINKGKLVEYWIGEDLIDFEENKNWNLRRGSNKIESARMYCNNVIQQLLDSCLLESCMGTDAVRMHDVLRDFALWKAEKSFLVHDMAAAGPDHIIDSWKEAERISLMQSRTIEFPRTFKCNKLLTLLINESNNIEKVLPRLFVSMSNLQVLDLSRTHVEHLPGSIGKLCRLKHLNLSNTPIRSLPRQVGYLVKLRQLNLSYTPSLEAVPYQAVSRLSNLWTLNMFHSGYDWKPVDNGILSSKRMTFTHLECLPSLHELGLSVNQSTIFTAFSESQLLRRATSLCLKNLSNDNLSIEKMKTVKELHISQLSNLSRLTFNSAEFPSLQTLKLVVLPKVDIVWTDSPSNICGICYLEIIGCHQLNNLTWVQHLLSLKEIFLANCSGLVEVIQSTNNNVRRPVSFERLRSITLESLPSLKSICQYPTQLPSLESLIVTECLNLKKLPVGDDNVEKMSQIFGEESWRQSLEWESDAIRTKLQCCFKDPRPVTWKEKDRSCSRI